MNYLTCDAIFTARIMMEASTPFSISSGKEDIFTDSEFVRDANGYPFIPGTSLAGSIRSFFSEEESNYLFGNSRRENEEEAKDSKVIVSSGLVLDSMGKVVETLGTNTKNDLIDKILKNGIIRHHVKINHQGTATDMGKFSETLVPAGTRFSFELQMISTDKDEPLWNKLIQVLANPGFRLGGGSRKGMGKFKIISLRERKYRIPDEIPQFSARSSSLNAEIPGDVEKSIQKNTEISVLDIVLKPEYFWFFGAPQGDIHSDMTWLKEKKIVWKENQARLSDDQITIPATGIKGPLRHRTKFYYALKKGQFADKAQNIEFLSAQLERGISSLFGTVEENEAPESKAVAVRGKLLFSDLYLGKSPNENAISENSEGMFTAKILNHVAIDRFTGGAVDGALYSERALFHGPEIKAEIVLLEKASIEKDLLEAFEQALTDMTSGKLPMGAGVNRGNGLFQGEWKWRE